MDQAFIAAAAAIAPTLPEGSSVSMSIQHNGKWTVLLHFAGKWMRDRGAEVGDWYGFDEETGHCQRNLLLKVRGTTVKGVESNADLGLSLEACRVANAA